MFDWFMTTKAELDRLKAEHPYSKIDVDVWPLKNPPKEAAQLTTNSVSFVHVKPYKIKRKSRLTLHFMPKVEDSPNAFEMMNRTPLMYKKSEHPNV